MMASIADEMIPAELCPVIAQRSFCIIALGHVQYSSDRAIRRAFLPKQWNSIDDKIALGSILEVTDSEIQKPVLLLRLLVAWASVPPGLPRHPS